MAEPHPNVVKFTRIIRAFNESDFDTLKALVSDDLQYYVAGGGMLGGEYQGPSAFAEFRRFWSADRLSQAGIPSGRLVNSVLGGTTPSLIRRASVSSRTLSQPGSNWPLYLSMLPEIEAA